MGDRDADNPADLDGDAEDPNEMTDREYTDTDEDDDRRTAASRGYHDRDDSSSLNYGIAAGQADTSAVAAVVRRYYAVALAGDGAMACEMYSHALAASAVEDYTTRANPRYLRGAKSCQAVATRVFRRLHHDLIAAGQVQITGVRISGNRAEALLGFRGHPANDIIVWRESGRWKIGGLIAETLR